MSLSYKISRLQHRYTASLNTHDPLHCEHGADVLHTCCCFSKFCFYIKINIVSIPVKCILFLCDCPWKGTIQRHCSSTKRLWHTVPSWKSSCSSTRKSLQEFDSAGLCWDNLSRRRYLKYLIEWRTWKWSRISSWVVRGCSEALNQALKIEPMKAANEPQQTCEC
jgi:hypothetical protein